MTDTTVPQHLTPDLVATLHDATQVSTSPLRLEVLAKHDDQRVREAVVRNPQTAPDVAIRLSSEFPEAFLQNPALFLWILDDQKFWERFSVDARVRILLQDQMESALWRDFTADEHTPIRRAVASIVKQNPDAYPNLLLRLLDDKDDEIRTILDPYEINVDTDSPADILDSFAHQSYDAGGFYRCYLIAQHPHTNVDTLTFLSKHFDARVRLQVAKNKNTPEEICHSLSKDEDTAVREAALFVLPADPTSFTRVKPKKPTIQTAQNPPASSTQTTQTAPTQTAPIQTNPTDEMLNDEERLALAQKPNLPYDVRLQLADDIRPNIRAAAAAFLQQSDVDFYTALGSTADLRHHRTDVRAHQAYLAEQTAQQAARQAAQQAAQQAEQQEEQDDEYDERDEQKERSEQEEHEHEHDDELLEPPPHSDTQTSDEDVDTSLTADVLAQIAEESVENMLFWRAYLVARHPKSDAHVLEILSKHAHTLVRRYTAQHANISLDTLRDLSDDDSYHYYTDSAGNWVRDRAPPILAAIARHEKLSALPDVLDTLAKHSNDLVRMIIAQRENLPDDILILLADDENKNIRSMVADRLSNDAKLLFSRLGSSENLRYHRNTDDEMPYTPDLTLSATEIADAVTNCLDASGTWRALLAAEHPNTDDATLSKIAAADNVYLRLAAAKLPRTPATALKKILEDERALRMVFNISIDIRRAIATNPNTNADTLRLLAEDPAYEVRRKVAVHPSADAKLLQQLALDPDDEVRYAVAVHPNADFEALDRLSVDDKQWARLWWTVRDT